MTAIMIAAASPTTTILRWVVRFAVYSDQFMSLTKSAPSPKDYCISRQRTYTKVQVAAVLPYSTVARLLSTSRASLFGLPAARYPTAGIAVRLRPRSNWPNGRPSSKCFDEISSPHRPLHSGQNHIRRCPATGRANGWCASVSFNLKGSSFPARSRCPLWVKSGQFPSVTAMSALPSRADHSRARAGGPLRARSASINADQLSRRTFSMRRSGMSHITATRA
jgi:hypothetical protein